MDDLYFILKVIFNHIPEIGLFAIIAGLVKIFTYYKLFNISIFGFIELKEVVLLFVSNLFAYAIILLYVALCPIIIEADLFSFFLPIAITILTFLYWKLRKHIYWYEFALQNVMFWGIFMVVYFTLKNHEISVDPKFDIYFLGIIFISLVSFAIMNAYNEYRKVKNKDYYKDTSIKLSTFEHVSTQDKYYIGKTDKYIFIYDEEKMETVVHPASKLERITFHK